MLKKLASWLLYKRMKWKKEVTIDFPDKFIICLAPHTSNWDFLIGLLYSRAEGIKSNFLAEHAVKAKSFGLCITPEGTRSLNPEWKKGFYYIALKANIPILLYGLDYKQKTIVCNQSIVPSGDIEEDMKTIKLYFKDFKGKHPELFTIGEIKE